MLFFETFENMLGKSVNKNNDEDKSVSCLTFEKEIMSVFMTPIHTVLMPRFFKIYFGKEIIIST